VLYKDCSVEEIRDELPECQPRFIVYSYCYEHDDGRKSYPLCFIFVSPQGLYHPLTHIVVLLLSLIADHCSYTMKTLVLTVCLFVSVYRHAVSAGPTCGQLPTLARQPL